MCAPANGELGIECERPGKVAKQRPQTDYTDLGMPLKLECPYLHKNVLVVGDLMELIESALREESPPNLFGLRKMYLIKYPG